MKIISTSYLIDNEVDVTSTDTIIKECIICRRKFAVPVVELDNEDEEVCCTDCEDILYDMSHVDDDIAYSEYDGTKLTKFTTKEVIEKALGN